MIDDAIRESIKWIIWELKQKMFEFPTNWDLMEAKQLELSDDSNDTVIDG